MFDQFLEFLKGILDKFLHPGDNSVESALQVLFTLPIPPISADSFKHLYSITWAAGIIAALLCGFVMAVFVLGTEKGRIGSVMPVAAKVSYFLRVFVVGFVAMPIVGALLILATELTKLVQKIPVFQMETSSFLDNGFALALTLLDPRQAFMMNQLAWAATTMLTMTTVAITFLVVPALLLTPIFYGLSVLGEVGLNLWRFWVSCTLVTILSKPLIAWWLGIGNFAITVTTSLPGFSVLGGWKSSLNIILVLSASFIPALILILSIIFVHPELRAASTQVFGAVTSEAVSSLMGDGSVDQRIARLTSLVGGSSSPGFDDETSASTANPSDASRLAIAELLSSNAGLAAAIHPAGPLVAQAASAVLSAGAEQAPAKEPTVTVEMNPAPRAEPARETTQVVTTGLAQAEIPSPPQPEMATAAPVSKS